MTDNVKLGVTQVQVASDWTRRCTWATFDLSGFSIWCTLRMDRSTNKTDAAFRFWVWLTSIRFPLLHLHRHQIPKIPNQTEAFTDPQRQWCIHRFPIFTHMYVCPSGSKSVWTPHRSHRSVFVLAGPMAGGEQLVNAAWMWLLAVLPLLARPFPAR